MDMSIQKYVVFIEMTEYGSFTKAAEVLNYSQFGISCVINDLEKEWKVILLEGRKSSVKLISDGMKLFPHAKSTCMEYEKLQMEVDELNGPQSGLTHIGALLSVATHRLSNIIREFQKAYPGTDYELLLGGCTEIEEWISGGCVDRGFLRLPTYSDSETILLEQDGLPAILPKNHVLVQLEEVPMVALCNEPFMLLEESAKAEVSGISERYNPTLSVYLTTQDDCAVMLMVENGLGVSILSELILKCVPCRIVAEGLNIPAYRRTGIALQSKKTASFAAKRFLEYPQYR